MHFNPCDLTHPWHLCSLTVVTNITSQTTAGNLISGAVSRASNGKAKAKLFLVATTSVKTRSNDILNHKLYRGVMFFAGTKRIRSVYLPHEAKFVEASMETTIKLLVQCSNDSTSFRPALLPTSITHNVVILLTGTLAEKVPDIFAPSAGKLFQPSDLDGKSQALAALLPAGQQALRIIIACASMPILPSAHGGYRGVVDENCISELDDNIDKSSAWASYIPLFRADVQAAVLADRQALGDLVPALKKANLEFAASPFFTPTPVDEDEEEEIKQTLDTLRATVDAIRGPTAPPVLAVDASTEQDDALSQVTGATGLIHPPHPKSANVVTPRIQRKPMLHNKDPAEIQYAKFSVMGLGFDETTGKAHAAIINDTIAFALANTSAKERNREYGQALDNAYVDLAEETDFVFRGMDPPSLNQPACALLLNAMHESVPLTDIENPSKGQILFRPQYLAPDNAAVAAQRDDLADTRVMEELCGEHDSNLSKMDTKILFNQQIFSYHTFLVFVKNLCGFFPANFQVNMADHEDRANPFLYRAYRTLCLALTTRQARQYFKLLPPSATNHHIFGWLLYVIDKLWITVASHLRQVRTVVALIDDDTEKIDTTILLSANKFFSDSMAKLIQCLNQVDTVPYCLISANLDARIKKRKDEKEAAQLAKRQKTAPDSKPAAKSNTTAKVEKDEDKSGCITFKAGSPMPTFDHSDPKKRVCPAHIREGVFCRRLATGRCNMLHEKKPHLWDPDTLKGYCRLIEITDGMEWSDSIDKAALLAVLKKYDAIISSALK